ncbi:hypothetical protein NHQ30_002479 [Ciborinia camelliae]|nr:hypothetical protein NHQ30_002479 [Ciborinia camelliae]
MPASPDVNTGGKALAVIWTLNAISITIVIARCMTQRFITRQLGLSDALVVVSMCVISSMASLITVQYHYGWGRHYIYLDPFDRIEALKYNAIGQSFGVMGSTFGRMSFIILMLQLFGTSRFKRIALWTLFWVQFIPNCIVVVTLYVQCSDVRALWDTSVVASCWPESYQTMNRRTKLGLVFLLSLSLLVLANRGDYTYNTVPVESNLVVIASSVPLLRPLFVRLKSGDFSTRHGTRSSAPTFELSGYHGKRKSIQNHHAFSQISDDDLSQLKDANHDQDDEQQRSADHILPIQGEKEREPEPPWVVKKEVSYSVRVEEAVGVGMVDADRDRDRDLDRDLEMGEKAVGPRNERIHLFVSKRGSKGGMSVLSGSIA